MEASIKEQMNTSVEAPVSAKSYLEQKLEWLRQVKPQDWRNAGMYPVFGYTDKIKSAIQGIDKGSISEARALLDKDRDSLQRRMDKAQQIVAEKEGVYPDDQDYREARENIEKYSRELQQLNKDEFPGAYALLGSQLDHARMVALNTKRGSALVAIKSLTPLLETITNLISSIKDK